MSQDKQDLENISYLRALVIDAVCRAKSGHIGGALSAMDVAYFLFSNCLRYDPDDPRWLLRDRFVLSAGHMSMLLYSLHYIIGYLQLRDLQTFRQLGSATPGHPENHHPAIECTTGPLGQGAAMAVGFAIAAAHHRATFDNGDRDLFDQQTVALLSDGCLQEGITLMTASYAGHLALDNLTWIYDRNAKQISGDIARVTSDNVEQIFRGFGWQVLTIDGHDHQQIKESLALIHQPRQQPLLIISNSTMSKGVTDVEGDHRYHGAPFPEELYKLSKKNLGVPIADSFYWPEQAAKSFQEQTVVRLRKTVAHKNRQLAQRRNDRQFAERLDRYYRPKIDFSSIPYMSRSTGATRKVFGSLLAHYADYLPNLCGGSADLEPSNMTEQFTARVGEFTRDNRQGRGFAFGVREFAMSAISNGLALYGGMIPFDATFLCFSDYARSALRLGALQGARVIHEYTHDSFWVGEDGPTHQPVEHLASLRAIPDFYVMRPADDIETEVMFRVAVNLDFPSAICLTRQTVEPLPDITDRQLAVAYGGYLIRAGDDDQLLLIASGSEVNLALAVATKLTIATRVVSMPCWELFDEQPTSYRTTVLPATITKRVAIEAGSAFGWQRYVGDKGLIISLDRFGKSGKGAELAEHLGFTTEAIIERLKIHFTDTDFSER